MTCRLQVVLILVCKVAGYVVEAIRLYNLLRQHLRELQVRTHDPPLPHAITPSTTAPQPP